MNPILDLFLHIFGQCSFISKNKALVGGLEPTFEPTGGDISRKTLFSILTKYICSLVHCALNMNVSDCEPLHAFVRALSEK